MDSITPGYRQQPRKFSFLKFWAFWNRKNILKDFFKNRNIENLPGPTITSEWSWSATTGISDGGVWSNCATVNCCCQMILVRPFLLFLLLTFFWLFISRFLHCVAQLFCLLLILLRIFLHTLGSCSPLIFENQSLCLSWCHSRTSWLH